MVVETWEGVKVMEVTRTVEEEDKILIPLLLLRRI